MAPRPPPHPPPPLTPPPLSPPPYAAFTAPCGCASFAAVGPQPTPPCAIDASAPVVANRRRVQASRHWPCPSCLRAPPADPTAPLSGPLPLQGCRPLPLSSPSLGRVLRVAVIVGSESTSLASSSSVDAGFEPRAPDHHRPGLQVAATCLCWCRIWAARCRPHLLSPPSCWLLDPNLPPPGPVSTCSSGEGGASSCSLCASRPTAGASAGGRTLVATDSSLTRWRATNPMPTERVATPALAAASPGLNPVVCGPTPSGCIAAAFGLASLRPLHLGCLPEPFEEDSLPMLSDEELSLHEFNVVSRLNAAEEFMLLSDEELSLHEFLLNQILLL
jgi:hypothetical protein